MARKSLADRLQAGFDVVPLTPEIAQPEQLTPEQHRLSKRVLAVFASLFLAGVLVLLAWAVEHGVWWNTKSTAICTVEDYQYQYHPANGGKDGPELTFTVHTDQCGTLKVQYGAGSLSLADAETLGDSLRSGDTYRMQLRGWDNWFNGPRGILGATDLTFKG